MISSGSRADVLIFMQVDNYGPEVMSRLSKILPGVCRNITYKWPIFLANGWQTQGISRHTGAECRALYWFVRGVRCAPRQQPILPIMRLFIVALQKPQYRSSLALTHLC